MAAPKTLAGLTNTIAVGGAALSLVGVTKALVTGNTPKGIQGFLFDIPETESVTRSAQITDHFTENNFAIQDHVAIDPTKITLTGKVGELIYSKTAIESYIETVLDRLGPLGILSPEQNSKVKQTISDANRFIASVDSAFKSFNDLASIFSGTPTQTAQQAAFAIFDGYFQGRALLTVETPWKTYSNMIIETFTSDQDATTTNETTFTITFKEMRIVSTTTNVGQLQGRIAQQKSEVINSGQQKGKSIFATVTDTLSGTTK